MRHFQPGDHRRELFDSLPTDQFIRIDALESLSLRTPTVLFKVKPSIPSVELSTSLLKELPFGRLEAVTCAGLVVGYQIVTPKCSVEVRANFAAISRRESPSRDADVLFVDRKVAVMGNHEAMLAVCSNIRWTSR